MACETWCIRGVSGSTAGEDSSSQLDTWEIDVTGFSNDLDAKIMAHVWGAGTDPFTLPPTEYWVSLHTSFSSKLAAGSEVVDAAYGRQRVYLALNDQGIWASTANLDFSESATSWGYLFGLGLWSAETGGDYLAYGNFAASIILGQSKIFHLAAGNLRVRLT